MTVYVDDMRRRATISRNRPMIWSHLMADTHEELVEFAVGLGLDPAWIQHEGTYREHFDVTDTKRDQAIRVGAIPITYPHETGNLLRHKAAGTPFDLAASR